MSDITLSTGIRNTLLSLQNTASDLTTTQEHLSTGKKVNTAFDNPSSYFTSQALTNRANDLSALLDQIGQAQQTLNAANNGLTSLTSLLEQALSTAQQAQQAPLAGATTYGAVNVTGTVPTAYHETIGSTTGSVDLSTPTEAAGNLLIATGGTTYTVGVTDSESLSDIESAISGTAGLSGAVTASDNGTNLILTANSAATNFTVDANALSAALGVTADSSTTNTVNSTSLFSLLHSDAGVANGDALTIAVNGGASQQITFGTGAGQVQTLAELNTALSGLTDVTASKSSNALSFAVASSSGPTSLTIGTSGSSSAGGILTGLGLTAGTSQGTATVGSTNSTRSTLEANYNSLLTQIDQLAGDASYNGVNLLNGDDLKVTYNETGTSSQTISGVTFNSTGLGLSQISGTGFQTNANITSAIDAINNAITNVRAQTKTFGTNSSTITTRQSFEQNMINTLQTGASNLVLADQNQESANLLTEQTQQQLEISSLSIANQANQAVLKLFP